MKLLYSEFLIKFRKTNEYYPSWGKSPKIHIREQTVLAFVYRFLAISARCHVMLKTSGHPTGELPAEKLFFLYYFIIIKLENHIIQTCTTTGIVFLKVEISGFTFVAFNSENISFTNTLTLEKKLF